MTSYVPDYKPEPGYERFIPDRASAMNPSHPRSLVFSMSTYQVYSEEAPTAVLTYMQGDTDLGLIMWNLLPGQENDYHVHPGSEHVQIVVAGEVEYTIADEEPMTLKVGDAVMVPAGIPHGVRNVSGEPASYFAAAVSKSGSYEKIHVERN
jgi:quercetin dioxygenase-like cupin family protein